MPQVVAAVAAATREGPDPRAEAAANDAEVASALTKLHALLIAPIADKLSADGRVVFFPHGPFLLTPFAALRSSTEGAAPLLDEERALIAGRTHTLRSSSSPPSSASPSAAASS